MDIVAHGLWAGLGALWLARRRAAPASAAVAAGPLAEVRVGGAQIAGAVALAMLPDVVHLAPVAAWAAFGGGSLGELAAYALATPATEPALPHWVSEAAHHLHCIMHSALIAGAVAWAVARVPRWWRLLALPLAGWWLHIGIDVFTHSADYYPAPVLYPLTQRGFDGLAWNTPWFLAANYAALALAAIALWRR
jgi:hypothetical protein